MFCGHLEGRDMEGGREGDARGRRCGDVCVCMADSLCCRAEANTPLWSNYTPIKVLKKKKKEKESNLRKQPKCQKKKIIYQETNTLIFQNHEETNTRIDEETLTLETNGGELDIF